MQALYLKLPTSLNQALNQGGVTFLRSLTLTQDTSYTVNLAFYDYSTPVVPTLSAFSFTLRTSDGTNLITASSATSRSGDYPHYFTFTNSSPQLATIGGNAFIDLHAIISFRADRELTVIEPFITRVFFSQTIGEADYVSKINGLATRKP